MAGADTTSIPRRKRIYPHFCVAALTICWVLSSAAGCGSSGPAQSAEPTSAKPSSAGCEPSSGERLPWFKDDYAAARLCAKTVGRPIVIDFWAKWCHTCLSMKNWVLRRENLRAYAGHFVWLAIETDLPKNAALMKQYPVSSWPTFLVVDPHDESIQARQVGAATPAEFNAFLATGKATYNAARGQPAPSNQMARRQASLRRAAQLEQSGDFPQVATLLDALISRSQPGESRLPKLLLSRVRVAYKMKDIVTCERLIDKRLHDTGGDVAALDFGFYAFFCLSQATANSPTKPRLARIATHTRKTLAKNVRLTPDDHAEGLRLLRLIYDSFGDTKSAKTYATKQRRILDHAAAQADNAFAAMTYNWPRAEVYAYLGIPNELSPALEASAAALPNEYDPPYRLAWIKLQAGLPEQALPWARTAASLAYGPRKARTYMLLASICKQLGLEDERAAALKSAIAILALEPARNTDTIAELKKSLTSAID